MPVPILVHVPFTFVCCFQFTQISPCFNSTLPCYSFDPYSLLRALFPPFSYLSSYRYLCCLCLYLKTLIQMFFLDNLVRVNDFKCVNMVQQTTRVTYCTLKQIKSALFRQTTKGTSSYQEGRNS